MFLLTAITHDPSAEEVERLWRTYYHFYVTSTDLLFVQQHCKKLLAASENISSWNNSPFGSSFKFSNEACLSEMRRMWSLYAQTRTKQEDYETKRAIKSMYDKHITREDGLSLVLHGVRSAGAHGIFAAPSLNEAFHSFWKTGVVAGNSRDIATLNQQGGGRANPLMVVSSLGSFNVHYGLDPLMGFHLAESFDTPQSTNTTADSLARLAKSQFSKWCHEFACFIASDSITIMHHHGDAVNFSHALQAIQGSATLPPFTYVYSKPWSSVPLDLLLDIATKYEVIDTSNVMDHVGILNLLCAVVPLLSGRRDSVLYTESLLQGAKESEKTLETLLHSNVTMSSLLFGIAPVGYLLGTTTDSTHVERLLHMSTQSEGRQRQYRMRIPWKHAAQGDSLMSTNSTSYRLEMNPHELAFFFMQMYLTMFREAEDISIRMQVIERKLTHPLAGDLGLYSRLSLVTLLASAKRNISTDWRECVGTLVDLITNDRSLIIGSNSLQELYMHLHLAGLYHFSMLEANPREHRTYYGDPRPAGEPGVLGQQSLPGTVHIALVVPRSKLAVFTGRRVDRIGTPGLHLNVRNHAFDNAFYVIDVFFGRFQSDAIDTANVVEDSSGWSGTSDMIVTCKVPTWGLLVGRRQDNSVELTVDTSPATSSYVPDLGFRLTVFGATLDSKNVRILTQAPCTKPGSVLQTMPTIVDKPSVQTSATVALRRDGTVQSIGVTNDFAPDSEEDCALKSGGLVEVSQISPCVLAVSIGELKNTSKFAFPFPIDGTACKLRIARKSSWIEIKAPPSHALQPGGFNLNPFPVIGQGSGSLAWGMGRVDPDLQPSVKISASTGEFLRPLSNMAMSEGEMVQVKGNQSPESIPPMIQLKAMIGHMFVACTGLDSDAPGIKVQLITLSHDKDYKCLVVVNSLRHDRDTGSVFLDAFLIVTTPDLVKRKSFQGLLNGKGNQMCLSMSPREEAMEMWRRLVPALAERCRSWEHAEDCKRNTEADVTFLCDCGLGKDAAKMPRSYKDVAEYATRIAIPVLSAVPYVESMTDQKLIPGMAAVNLGQKDETSSSDVCDNCGSDKPGLKACSRCEKVKYCNHACQKAAWKKHKKDCKR